MLTQTTETAIQSLLYLARSPGGTLISPNHISSILDTSTSYTSKILRTLARAGLLEAHRGAAGGYALARKPEDINLLMVYRACQDSSSTNYCKSLNPENLNRACGYHRAMAELERTFIGVLEKWTLAKILEHPSPPVEVSPHCKSRWTHRTGEPA